MPLPNNDQTTGPEDKQYVHIRSLIANIHQPRNVSRPPIKFESTVQRLDVVKESQSSSEAEKSESCSEGNSRDITPPKSHSRIKSNSISGCTLAPPNKHFRKRRSSFLPLNLVFGDANEAGPASAHSSLSVPRFTVTAPPGDGGNRRHSHAFTAFHGFALRRHSNTSLHRSESMLSLACFKTITQFLNNDDTTELQQYLANNKNINIDDRDENGTTSLMCAAENNREAAIRLLLCAGADPNCSDADGWTSLAFATKAGHLSIVKELLAAGAVVDSRDCGGWTPLLWASYKGHEDIVDLLLLKGADVHAHGNYNINSLVWAAGRKHSGVVQRLLAAGARANSCDKYATSALTWAARSGDVTSCTALLKAGADPNTAGMYCWTPLLQATQGNHVEIVQMLLEYKPNVNALDKDGFTALAIACKEGNYDIAIALINCGAYINVQDHSKDTPLINAVKGGHKNIVEALLKKHVDVDLPGKEKKTPVYTAVEKGHVSLLKLLLASNPDLELCTTSGDTPLLRAVRSRNPEMVQLLIEKKARVNAVDKRGDTALHIAMRARSKNIVEILLRNPKNSQLLYKPNKLNETPYNIDMGYNKTILGQIFGARKLNTNEDNENMLGYELYSCALADMLSEPSLSMPITVGLFARWGSGKSFLLGRLKDEMSAFARQWREQAWAWSWAVAWATFHVAAWLAAMTAVLATPLTGVATLLPLFAGLYLAFYLLWSLAHRYETWWSGGLLSALGRRFNSLLLVLQVMFCHPPGPNDPTALPATPIRFHFTDGMRRGVAAEDERCLSGLVRSLSEAVEAQYGAMATRLTRAMLPRPKHSSSPWRWRRACCIPHIIIFEFCFMCFLVGLVVLFMYLKIDRDDIENQKTVEVVRGVGVWCVVVVVVAWLANVASAGRLLLSLVLSPRNRLSRAITSTDKQHIATALAPEVKALTDVVCCLDAFTGQQTRLVVVVDALDSCEQEKVLSLLNSIHALCAQAHSPFILLLAIDPHIISKAVEVNSRRAFSESSIGGWDYLRNMVQLPFYLQNSALRRVKASQHAAAKRMQALAADDLSSSLQRSVSARRLSSTSELMSSQERIKGQALKEPMNSNASMRARRLKPSESVASSIASGLHRAGVPPTTGAAELSRVLLTDDYFSDVNPRSMRRLMNVLYITGRLLKAFQIEFNWYQLASWVNLTEQWPFRTSWIIYHHETYGEHIDDSTSLKHLFEKVKTSMIGLREGVTLMELDRDERKLEVFLNFHRSTLTAADLKIFVPFTINLDPYIKKVIKEEQIQAGFEDENGAGAANSIMSWTGNQLTTPSRYGSAKVYQKKQRQSPQNAPQTQPAWHWNQIAGNNGNTVKPYPQTNLRNMFPSLNDMCSIRLSSLSIEALSSVVQKALPGEAGRSTADALHKHRVCGTVLAYCTLDELRNVLNLPFGDWEMFKMLVTNLRDIEINAPLNAPIVNVIAEKSTETETESAKRPSLDHQRSRPSNVEKQVTLEEQTICGALQTLSEEAMEDVQGNEPQPHPDESNEIQFRIPTTTWNMESPSESPLTMRREPSILKMGSVKGRRQPVEPSSVKFVVENEDDSDDGQITFSARRQSNTTRPLSLVTAYDVCEHTYLKTRSASVEDSARVTSPLVLTKNATLTADLIRKTNSNDCLSVVQGKLVEANSDDESAPLVSPNLLSVKRSHKNGQIAIDSESSLQDLTNSEDLSPRSEVETPSEMGGELDMLPESKGGARVRRDSSMSLGNMVEPYNMRLLARGGSDSSRLWRQDALDSAPPWFHHDPDSAV